MGLAQNEMRAEPALPERVRSMEGLGVTRPACFDTYKNCSARKETSLPKLELGTSFHSQIVQFGRDHYALNDDRFKASPSVCPSLRRVSISLRRSNGQGDTQSQCFLPRRLVPG